MRVHRNTTGSGQWNTNAASSVAGSTTSQPQIMSTMGNVAGNFVNVFTAIASSIYMLADKEHLLHQLRTVTHALLPRRAAEQTLRICHYANDNFTGFFIGKIIDSAIIGVLCYFGMLILKLPYPILVATVIGITNVIPFFGPIIGAVPCAFLILLVNPLQCFYFVIFVICLQQLDGNVIGPKILGNTVGISGFWVLVSITVAAGLFGFAGMLLGVPVFAIIYLLISDAINLSLKKKGDTTKTDAYYSIEEVSDLQAPAQSAGTPEPDAQSPSAKP